MGLFGEHQTSIVQNFRLPEFTWAPLDAESFENLPAGSGWLGSGLDPETLDWEGHSGRPEEQTCQRKYRPVREG